MLRAGLIFSLKEGEMSKFIGMRWIVVVAAAAMLLVLAAACAETVEVPGKTIVVEKEVIKEVEVRHQ